jgi:hypothetical protein
LIPRRAERYQACTSCVIKCTIHVIDGQLKSLQQIYGVLGPKSSLTEFPPPEYKLSMSRS